MNDSKHAEIMADIAWLNAEIDKLAAKEREKTRARAARACRTTPARLSFAARFPAAPPPDHGFSGPGPDDAPDDDEQGDLFGGW